MGVTLNFNAGELSPLLRYRCDIDTYSSGAVRLENFIVTPQGGIENRPGVAGIYRGGKEFFRSGPADPVRIFRDGYCDSGIRGALCENTELGRNIFAGCCDALFRAMPAESAFYTNGGYRFHCPRRISTGTIDALWCRRLAL